MQEVPLDEYPEMATAPADLPTLSAYRFIEHPTNHSVLPTAATCTLTGFQFQPRPGGIAAGAVPMLVVDSPVSVEVEPNDDAAKGRPSSFPPSSVAASTDRATPTGMSSSARKRALRF